MVNLVGGCKGISVEDRHVYRPHFSYAIVENRRETQKLVISKKKKKWFRYCFEIKIFFFVDWKNKVPNIKTKEYLQSDWSIKLFFLLFFSFIDPHCNIVP